MWPTPPASSPASVLTKKDNVGARQLATIIYDYDSPQPWYDEVTVIGVPEEKRDHITPSVKLAERNDVAIICDYNKDPPVCNKVRITGIHKQRDLAPLPKIDPAIELEEQEDNIEARQVFSVECDESKNPPVCDEVGVIVSPRKREAHKNVEMMKREVEKINPSEIASFLTNLIYTKVCGHASQAICDALIALSGRPVH
ncbi:hypothetical protein NA57DRAFT_75641 [Rhizodiscina lignyota]|uniref:Uncharacterized protein n=1 Tax=Rhizodiscina lignyota TaxID=1504668 RepID=A0A9P4IL42_9PEZI|nr:hypothetical protein NA57DRAFT_75641 [Rhizodiscina lignyota]